MSAILEFFFRLRLQPPHHSNHRAIVHQATKFRPNRVTRGGVMTSYTISRWRPRRLHTTSGFVLDDVTPFQRSTSTSKPNFISILPVWKNNRPPYLHFISGFDFDHITVLGMLLCRISSNGLSSAEIWCHIDFQDGVRCGAILLLVSDRMTSLFLACQFLSANQIS